MLARSVADGSSFEEFSCFSVGSEGASPFEADIYEPDGINL